MKKLLMMVAFTFAAHFAKAQSDNIEEIQQFVISDVRYNNADVTPIYLDAKAYISLYRVKGEETIYMANVWPVKRSQSYGQIYSITQTSTEATDDTFKNETLTFKWSYKNDFDSKQGTASIKLGLIYKPTGIAFLMTMITEDLNVTQFKGYVSGSLNLK